MAEFGYGSYVVSAGDVGCDVAESLAARYPERVAALHLTDVSQLHFLIDLPDDLSDAERAYVERGRTWQHTEGAYMYEQSTKPHTLAVGLGDSPAGLAAWLLESCAAGQTPAATSSQCSRATSSSPGSPPTGSPARSAPRSRPTSKARTRLDPRAGSTCRRRSRSFRATSLTPLVSSPSDSSTFDRGATNRPAAISRLGNAQTLTPKAFALR